MLWGTCPLGGSPVTDLEGDLGSCGNGIRARLFEYETGRLRNSAQALSGLLHENVRYPEGALVLEAPCGVGAQTGVLMANSPGARFVCMDISPVSVRAAAERSKAMGFVAGDLYALPFSGEVFDHVFACFVLEHLSKSAWALETCCAY